MIGWWPYGSGRWKTWRGPGSTAWCIMTCRNKKPNSQVHTRNMQNQFMSQNTLKPINKPSTQRYTLIMASWPHDDLLAVAHMQLQLPEVQRGATSQSLRCPIGSLWQVMSIWLGHAIITIGNIYIWKLCWIICYLVTFNQPCLSDPPL